MFHLKIDNPGIFFATSDTHFDHYNICRYCNRPFASREEMNSTLIENWNSVVPEDGIVVHCGDFTMPHKTGFKEYERIVRHLNGTIYLVRGNHDRIDLGQYSIGDKIKMIVHDMMKIRVDGVDVFAQHYPCLAFNGDYQVFGHIHTLSDGSINGIDGGVPGKLKWNQYDVGVDQNGYTPVSWEQLKRIFEKRDSG